jgi:hypothetical protein
MSTHTSSQTMNISIFRVIVFSVVTPYFAVLVFFEG